MKKLIRASFDFDKWYESLTTKTQHKVDDLADDLGLPDYEDCTSAELSMLHDNFISSIKGSYDPTEADLYIVKIWHEIDPGHDSVVPEAAEEIIEVVANSPDQAIERAKDQWDGPIDRIEIVDINPDDEELPVDGCSGPIESAGVVGTTGKSTSKPYI